MAKTKRFSSANRAWNMLRFAMLWARKGIVVKRKLVIDLRLASNYIKALKRNSIRNYGEHELSFDETPMVRVKMYKPTSMRFRIPCFTPAFGDDNFGSEVDERFDCNYALEDATGEEDLKGVDYDDEEIDERAEKFIADFYEQMRLQRQMSRLEYIQ